MTIQTLYVADKAVGAVGNLDQNTSGTVDVSGGVLTVTTALVLGDEAVFGGAASQATATLNITGGTVTCDVPLYTSNSTTAAAKSTLTLNGGVLDMDGNAIGSGTAAIIGGGGGGTS